MPTGTLAFDLPAEEHEHRIAVYSGDLYQGVCAFTEWLSRQIGAEGLTGAEYQTLTRVRSTYWATVMEQLPDDLR